MNFPFSFFSSHVHDIEKKHVLAAGVMYCNFAFLNRKIKLVTKFNQIRTFQKKKFSEPKMSNFSEKTGTFFSERQDSKLAAEIPEKVSQKKVFLTFGFFAEIWFCDQTAFPLCCKNTFLANLVGVKYSSASGRLVNVRFWKKNWT